MTHYIPLRANTQVRLHKLRNSYGCSVYAGLVLDVLDAAEGESDLIIAYFDPSSTYNYPVVLTYNTRETKDEWDIHPLDRSFFGTIDANAIYKGLLHQVMNKERELEQVKLLLQRTVPMLEKVTAIPLDKPKEFVTIEHSNDPADYEKPVRQSDDDVPL